MAILRLELIANGKRESEDLPGCPWACTVMQDNLCFWSFANRFEFGPMDTKDISEVLGLSPAQILKAGDEAIEKLRNSEDFSIITAMAETAQELDRRKHDCSIYLTEASTVTELESLAEESGAIPRSGDE
jgi:hypothetical protein